VAHALAALRRPVTYLRVLFLLIGSAMALSLALLAVTLIIVVAQYGLVWLTIAAGVVIVAAVPLLVAAVPAARQVEGVAAESLLGVTFAGGSPGPALRTEDRARATLWFVLHVLAGGLVVLDLAVLLPFGLAFLTAPLSVAEGEALTSWGRFHREGGWSDAWMPLVGLVLVLAAAIGPLLLGALMARAAPLLLGPSYAQRLHRLEAETARLAERNRIARELHDSVGHALSVVALQAGAARRSLTAPDRGYADEALEAIESTARSATAELDHALGLLRDGIPREAAGPGTAPGLDGLDALIAATQRAGLRIEAAVSGELGVVPGVVSREAYRIVQEGLTNALRHSADRSARLEVSRRSGSLVIAVSNPAAAPRPTRNGRGLRGIRERAQALGGSLSTATADGTWRLVVELPLPADH
jgi:signal transduction histidine kinase